MIPADPAVYFNVFTMPLNFDNEIYWLGSVNSNNTTKLTHFLCFDLEKEAFTSMKCPDIEVVAEERYLKRCSAVLDNSFAVLDCYDGPNGVHGSVWKGVKSSSGSGFSWSKQHKLDVTNNVPRPRGFSRHKVEMWFRNLPKGSISDDDVKNHEDELRALFGANWLRMKFLDSNDYKVLAIKTCIRRFNDDAWIAVYSFTDHLWREKPNPVSKSGWAVSGFRSEGGLVCCGGVVYWINRSHKANAKLYLYNFDVEEFSVMQLPDAVKEGANRFIFAHGESLGVLMMSSESSCIWVLEKDGGDNPWRLWFKGDPNLDAPKVFDCSSIVYG
uniref:F-box associated beta-propeller type 1 domain-containing protein n=1 Tax=Chenopodium quinoa TaxID=63459 RepID=A0A803L8S0_CHEQI